MDLRPMSQASYEVYLERLIVEYAEDKVGSSNWPEDGALTRSRHEITRLLVDGVSTPGHALFDLSVPDEEEAVGVLWLGIIEDGGARKGFIYDIWIRPDLRRRGLGRTAMLEAERWARSLGLTSLGLHVFGHNQAALSLYEKLEYTITDLNMTKQLN